MSLTYNSWLVAAANLAGTQITNPFFLIEAPNAIDYAEERIFRELDMLFTITTDASQFCVPNKRFITIPNPFVVVNAVNIITPVGTAPDNGTRNQLTKSTEAVLDFTWPSAAGATVPRRFALQNQATMLFGPWPDLNYVVEIIGTQRPAPLSNGNQMTFLSTNLPDLFLAATMVHIAGYQKNFGAQADDPRLAVSWEAQYGALLGGCNAEELRKRYAGTIVTPPPGMKPPVAPVAR